VKIIHHVCVVKGNTAMSDDEQTLKDNVAFLRALAEGDTTGVAREGAILVAVGVIFSLVAVQYWAIESGLFTVSPLVSTWLWLDGLFPFLICSAVISAKFRAHPSGATSRALAATWKGVGTAFIVADIALYAASRELGIPLLVKWIFPLVVFALIGGAWGVAFAVRRRGPFGLLAGGNFAAAILCGIVIGRPQEWLVLAGGLIFLVAVPAGVMLVARPRR
jgi:hypothetical protein